jgi:hypothetical protein
MTPQEKPLLQDFLSRLTHAQAGTKDPQAQALIDNAFAQQPDATYLLVQRALLLEQALKQAQAQIAQLQEPGESSFLGGASASSEIPRRVASAERAYGAPASAPSPQPAARAPGSGSGLGSFLGNAAATAAGVAGGAFLFQGLEDLFGHHGGTGGFLGGSVPPETIENVTVNNYGSDSDWLDGDAGDDSQAYSDQNDLDDASDDSSST